MNPTMNGSNCTSPFNPTAEKIATTLVLCLILLVSLIGNFFIVLIVYRTKTMRKTINYFIFNLALSDLVFSTNGFLFDLTKLYMDVWPLHGAFGYAWCKLSTFLTYMSACVSTQSLVLIAVDRFGAVVFPLRSPVISLNQCPYFIVASWMVAVAVSVSPMFFAVNLVEHSGKLACKWQSNNSFRESSSALNYIVALNVLFFYISITLLIILYSIIFYKLKSQKTPGERSMKAQEQREKRNRNVLKMAIAIVLAFFISWIPFSIVMLLDFYHWKGRLPCGMLLYEAITNFMIYASCAANPFICFIFSVSYRQGLKKLVNCFDNMQE